MVTAIKIIYLAEIILCICFSFFYVVHISSALFLFTHTAGIQFLAAIFVILVHLLHSKGGG